jgi:hypothetical protein
MNQRSTHWLAAAGLLVAVLARGIGVVAVVSANASSAAPSMEGMGMSMSGSRAIMNHMTPAPMDGVPDATETTGGQPPEGGETMTGMDMNP